MFFKKKKEQKNETKKVDVRACFDGKAIPLEKVNDPVFSEKILGDGIAIEPENGTLYAPVTGKVSSIMDTKHAIGFELENGAEVLLHIGIDTVELKGEGFTLNINVEDQVNAGEPIGKIDLDFLKSKGKETASPILLTSMDSYKLNFARTEGPVHAGDILYSISFDK